MVKQKLSNEEITLECLGALAKLSVIYNDFDILNGHLQVLTENLDDEKYSYFFHLWKTFPTYNELDDLKDILYDVMKEKKESVENK